MSLGESVHGPVRVAVIDPRGSALSSNFRDRGGEINLPVPRAAGGYLVVVRDGSRTAAALGGRVLPWR